MTHLEPLESHFNCALPLLNSCSSDHYVVVHEWNMLFSVDETGHRGTPAMLCPTTVPVDDLLREISYLRIQKSLHSLRIIPLFL